MSWIGGQLVINSLEKKDIAYAKSCISCAARSEANLEEFPSIGMCINPIVDMSLGKVFDSIEDAVEYLESIRSTWSRSKSPVVPFKDIDKELLSAKGKTLKERIEKKKAKLEKYLTDNDVSKQKAALITCPSCKSKVNKLYIKKNICPVCRFDLHSTTAKNTILRYRQNIKDLEKALLNEQKNEQKKAKVKYLIMYEEYVG